MTEPATPCVRGCARRALKDNGEEGAVPREATDGLLCKRCADNLRGWIKGIPDLYAQLDIRLTSGSGQDGSRRTKISGSPALIRLDVMALMDPRTRIGVEMKRPGEAEEITYQHYESTVHVPTAMLQWAQCLIDDHGLSGKPTNLTDAVALLSAWYPQVCSALWVDEFYEDVRVIHSTLWRTTDQPQPVGWCFGQDPRRGCGAPLFWEQDPKEAGTLRLRCQSGSCGRIYKSAEELLRLKIQAMREGRAV